MPGFYNRFFWLPEVAEDGFATVKSVELPQKAGKRSKAEKKYETEKNGFSDLIPRQGDRQFSVFYKAENSTQNVFLKT